MSFLYPIGLGWSENMYKQHILHCVHNAYNVQRYFIVTLCKSHLEILERFLCDLNCKQSIEKLDFVLVVQSSIAKPPKLDILS